MTALLDLFGLPLDNYLFSYLTFPHPTIPLLPYIYAAVAAD